MKARYFTVLLFLLIYVKANAQKEEQKQLLRLEQQAKTAAEKNLDSLENYAKKGIELANKLNKKQSLLTFKRLIGHQAYKQSNYKKAAENLIEAIKIGETQSVSAEYIRALFDASELYRQIDQDTSMNYIRKGLFQANSLKDKTLIGDGFNRLGYAFELRNLNDSAVYYYKKGLQINIELKNKIGTSYAYESVAGILNKQGKHLLALDYLHKAYQLRIEVNDKFAQSISLINIGETSKALKRNDSAIFYAKKAYQTASQIAFLDLMAHCDNFISGIYKEQGNFAKALEYKEKHHVLRDSIYNTAKAKQIAELNTKYQTQKNQQQIKILSQSSTINQLKIKQKNFLLGIAITVIIGGIILTYFILNRRKLKAKSILQAEIIKQQDIASKAVLDAEERERRRIAGDLHDGVGQMLSAALMNLNGLFAKLNLQKETNLQAEKALALVNESYDEMRSISHQMMPNALIKSGLASAVKEFIGKLDQDKLKVTLETVGLNERLEEQTETVIYRVIQETVNNVVKHAEASKLDIQIIKDEEGISVTIEDNGKGFDKNKNNLKNGIGLSNIYSRVEFLKGTVDIDSTEGKGTLVAIHLP